jgi:hypothetical protein
MRESAQRQGKGGGHGAPSFITSSGKARLNIARTGQKGTDPSPAHTRLCGLQTSHTGYSVNELGAPPHHIQDSCTSSSPAYLWEPSLLLLRDVGSADSCAYHACPGHPCQTLAYIGHRWSRSLSAHVLMVGMVRHPRDGRWHRQHSPRRRLVVVALETRQHAGGHGGWQGMA